MSGRAQARRARARGRAAELRGLALLADVAASVPWIRSWREATSEEDAYGIDVIVEADVGELPLQIKASRRNARRAIYRERGIGVVVVNEHKSDWHVEADLRETLSGMRAAAAQRGAAFGALSRLMEGP